MAVSTIDAKMLKKMFLAGAKSLEARKEWINELNVFPVPDGDTGTNMTLTIMSAAKEVQNIKEPTLENLAKAISSGSLRGARGNSGVILSQLLRGFTKEIKSADEINAGVMANAFQRAAETAYKAVMKPKEGTILTVARGMADKASQLAEETEDLEEMLKAVLEHGDYVLSQTPEMLPVLKQAGVVDSGGQGLMQALKGAYDAFLGKEIDLSSFETTGTSAFVSNVSTEEVETADIKFGYCTEFIVNIEKAFDFAKENSFKKYLESIGDSIVVVSDEDLIKVHVHTNDPGLALQKALTYGSLSRIKIDNMREEHQEKLFKEAEKKALEEQQKDKGPRKPYGFISISVGDGLNEIFDGLNVDYLVEGGQTMNPSTEDMLNAIDQVNADVIYIFPNNKNIILAAEQAKNLEKDKKIIVIPSKTVPQGITAIINFAPDKTPEENAEQMAAEMARVKTGQVTYAVRNTSIDGKDIEAGDIMGIGDAGILAVGKEVAETALLMLDSMVDEDSELISIYYGEDIKQESAEALNAKVAEAYPDCDIEFHRGGQPVYYYIMSVE